VAAPDHKIRQCVGRSALFPGRAMDGTKVPSDVWISITIGIVIGIGLGAVAPPHTGVWGLCPQKKIFKNQL